MSKVSKLVIKACSDNKFSSFTGEFITSINPENLVIKSSVSYHVPEGMTSSNLLKYRGSPPKLLSFSLLFDNTGIIPGSNAIAVMEQVKQLQDVAYSVHKKNNAPNYIRIIWGQIDFKGRLVDLDIVYSMFQVDGTLVRAEAHISVLEEIVPLGKGKSAAGVDSNYEKASGAHATRKVPSSQGRPGTTSQEVFAPTPNGMNGAYSGAPPGAYDGGPDQIYHGSSGSGGPVYGPTTAASPSASSASSVETPGSNGYDSGVDRGRSASYTPSAATDHSGNNLNKGGVAGNGPGGSGGGIGGGGHGPSSGAGKSGRGTVSSGAGSPASKSGGNSPGAGSGPAGSAKGHVAAGPGDVQANGKDSGSKMGKIVAAGAAGSAAAAAAASGADSLRKLSGKVNLMEKMKEKVSFWRRLKNFAKKVSPKGYEAGKKLVKKSGF